MQQREGTLQGPHGGEVYYRYWLPDEAPKALILLVHGAGEHSGRYQGFAERACAEGYAIAAPDHPGHGRSAGHRVYVDRFDDYLDALRSVQEQAQSEFPDLPVFLLGHSLGGLISCCYLLRHQGDFVGCVLSGAALATELEPGWFQSTIIRLLSRLTPRLGMMQLDATAVSRDPQEVQRYIDDPLVHSGKVPARFLVEFMAAMQRIQQRAGEIELPLLILHGSADSLTSPEGSRFLQDAAASADKTLTIYPGLYHEIFNEPERDAVIGDVLQWCDQKLQSAAG